MHKYVRKDMEGSRSFAPQMNTDTAKSGLEDYFVYVNVGEHNSYSSATLSSCVGGSVCSSIQNPRISSPWSLHLPPCACHGGSHWNQTAAALRSGFSKTWAEKPGTNHPQVPICCSASLNQTTLRIAASFPRFL